jgi:Nitrile hydratase beta subunit
MRQHHDMGGQAAGPVIREEHDYALWEKRVDAMLVLLTDKKRAIMRVDELRRGIEQLPPDAYDRLNYYQRWIHSIAAILTEKGVLDKAELEARVAALKRKAGTAK